MVNFYQPYLGPNPIDLESKLPVSTTVISRYYKFKIADGEAPTLLTTTSEKLLARKIVNLFRSRHLKSHISHYDWMIFQTEDQNITVNLGRIYTRFKNGVNYKGVAHLTFEHTEDKKVCERIKRIIAIATFETKEGVFPFIDYDDVSTAISSWDRDNTEKKTNA